MTEDAGTLAAIYFRAWKGKDFAILRSVLADDVTLRGPLGSADDAETFIQGMKGMREIITDIVSTRPSLMAWMC
ncbi:MAG: nuclear transport factor 2 family protein [Candidatus Dormibacteraceae bacterium]